MAKNIQAQVLGGETKTGLEAETVQGVYTQLGLSGQYAASVNGEPVEGMSEQLEDYNYVMFSPAVKGGI